jgi:hypothetical protein
MAAPTLAEFRAWIANEGRAPVGDDLADAVVERTLLAATEQVEGRCLPQYVDPADPDFVEYPESIWLAILLVAYRFLTRKGSPQAVAGFDSAGNLFRVLAQDPDVSGLLARYEDLSDRFA